MSEPTLLYTLREKTWCCCNTGRIKRMKDREESADSGQLLAAEDVHDPHVPDAAAHEDLTGRLTAVVTASLPPDVVMAAQERGQARDPEATAANLLAELEG